MQAGIQQCQDRGDPDLLAARCPRVGAGFAVHHDPIRRTINPPAGGQVGAYAITFFPVFVLQGVPTLQDNYLDNTRLSVNAP